LRILPLLSAKAEDLRNSAALRSVHAKVRSLLVILWLGCLRLLHVDLSQLDLVLVEVLSADRASERLSVLLGELDEVFVAVLVHNVTFPAGQFDHLLPWQHLDHAEGTVLNFFEYQSAGQCSLETLSNAADVHVPNGLAKVVVLHGSSSAEPDVLWLAAQVVVSASSSGSLHSIIEFLSCSVHVGPVLFSSCSHALVSSSRGNVGLRFFVFCVGVVQFEAPFDGHVLLEVAGDQLISESVGLNAVSSRIPLIVNLDRPVSIKLWHIFIAHASATAAQYLEENKDANSRAVEDWPLDAQQDQAQAVSRESVLHATGGNRSEFFAL